jgi:hypothetical protein
MKDKPPLLGKIVLGRIVPMNGPAAEAVKACAGMNIRFEIKRSGSNERRRGFYWVMLDVAAEALTDATGSPWDAESLHDELKRKLRLGTPLLNKKGEETGFKPQSTSNRAMTEAERSRWTDRCAHVLSTWLEVEITELMNEARARNGGIGPDGERQAA